MTPPAWARSRRNVVAAYVIDFALRVVGTREFKEIVDPAVRKAMREAVRGPRPTEPVVPLLNPDFLKDPQ